MPDHRPTDTADLCEQEARGEAIERFHRGRAAQLRRAVAAQVHTHDHTVLEDACQTAWLTLVRRPDVPLDDRGMAWLTTTAVREGWKLARPQRDIPSGCFRRSDDLDAHEQPEPPSHTGDPEDLVLKQVELSTRVSELETLGQSQRQVLLLHAAGYRYREIAALTGSSRTTTNRHIAEGRARLAHRVWLRERREQREG